MFKVSDRTLAKNGHSPPCHCPCWAHGLAMGDESAKVHNNDAHTALIKTLTHYPMTSTRGILGENINRRMLLGDGQLQVAHANGVCN